MAILIVEDDFNSREGLKLSLLAEGYQVEAVKDGLQAIKTVLDRKFAVAIVDINLPTIMDVTITGWDLVRIFGSIDPAMAVIVVSAEEGIEGQARQSPDARFLRKPINPSQLKAMLKTLIPYRSTLRQPPDLPVI
jgi:two-component system response regulator ResD